MPFADASRLAHVALSRYKYKKEDIPASKLAGLSSFVRHADKLRMLRIPRCRGVRRMLAKKDTRDRMQASVLSVFFTSAWLIATRIIVC